jgi:hypothetical protein
MNPDKNTYRETGGVVRVLRHIVISLGEGLAKLYGVETPPVPTNHELSADESSRMINPTGVEKPKN